MTGTGKSGTENFAERLRSAIAVGLPGSLVQWEMAPTNRTISDLPEIPGSECRTTAVLIILFPYSDSIHTVFMQRPDYTGFHGGQISFPGGKQEKQDENLTGTALREASEETGINFNESEVLGSLTPLYIPVSNTMVTAVPCWLDNIPAFKPDPREVDFLIIADLKKLAEPDAIRTKQMIIRDSSYDIKYFNYDGHVIWGATAMMLNELLAIIKREQLL